MSFVLLLSSRRGSGESSESPSSERLLSGSKKHPQHQRGDSSGKSVVITMSARVISRLHLRVLGTVGPRLRLIKVVKSAIGHSGKLGYLLGPSGSRLSFPLSFRRSW
jgi:hypothetical protein